ncbi:SDR family oxidoreductase [Nocardia alni]|uniref:SDR family oxidoreductase n=1 Tax=Nocardia alni TaxID=2815723 RepID=UPI0027DF921E|nr:SDR family oxidoreductase [Nocardia alni]
MSIMTGTYGLYSGSKAAVERMVIAAAKELGDRGITVNAVAPGPVDDDFYRSAETPESIAAASQHSPRGRLGLPSDKVADAASAGMCGKTLPSYLVQQYYHYE